MRKSVSGYYLETMEKAIMPDYERFRHEETVTPFHYSLYGGRSFDRTAFIAQQMSRRTEVAAYCRYDLFSDPNDDTTALRAESFCLVKIGTEYCVGFKVFGTKEEALASILAKSNDCSIISYNPLDPNLYGIPYELFIRKLISRMDKFDKLICR